MSLVNVSQDLIDQVNRDWMARHRDLRPIYAKVYMDLTLTVGWLFLGVGTMKLLSSHLAFWGWLTLFIVMPFYLGFFLHQYTLYFHEASHFNLHPNRKTNDLLASLLITPFIGFPIKAYRASHWQHHLHLGTDRDTEISYTNALDWIRLIKLFSGIYLLETLLRYIKNFSSGRADTNSKSEDVMRSSKTSAGGWFFLTLLVFGLTQLGIATALSRWIHNYAGFIWMVSVFIAAPAWAFLRQCLEHRAKPYMDSQRAVNRNFGVGLWARHFGGAGFNRHVLHHWSPGLSYTLFDTYESFIEKSPLGSAYQKCTTNYGQTFMSLLSREKDSS